jgi:hypothetical protein
MPKQNKTKITQQNKMQKPVSGTDSKSEESYGAFWVGS